jgi:phosphatidylserine/phosphatidylglycerophosphate/cardiolipin synthase-like enzyme
MKRTYLTSWHFLLILAAIVLFLTDRNSPSAPQTEAPPPKWQVCFSLRGGATSAIVRTLDEAKKLILIQTYLFTLAPMASPLVRSHKRGVEVQVILNRCQRIEKYSSADFLMNAGIKMLIDTAHAIAHNEVIIIDNETVITGSLNFTKAAEERNTENPL